MLNKSELNFSTKNAKSGLHEMIAKNSRKSRSVAQVTDHESQSISSKSSVMSKQSLRAPSIKIDNPKQTPFIRH